MMSTPLLLPIPNLPHQLFTLLPAQAVINENIGNDNGGIIDDHEPRLAPANAINLKAGHGPKKGRGKKFICMRRNINQNVYPPGRHLPEKSFGQPGEKDEDREKNNQAVRDIVEAVNILRYERRIGRLSAGKVRTHESSRKSVKHKINAKRKNIGHDAKKYRLPNMPGSIIDRAGPEAVGKEIHGVENIKN